MLMSLYDMHFQLILHLYEYIFLRYGDLQYFCGVFSSFFFCLIHPVSIDGICHSLLAIIQPKPGITASFSSASVTSSSSQSSRTACPCPRPVPLR